MEKEKTGLKRRLEEGSSLVNKGMKHLQGQTTIEEMLLGRGIIEQGQKIQQDVNKEIALLDDKISHAYKKLRKR